MADSPLRRYVAETTGTALFMATIVGSGIMGERTAGGNIALAMLGNSLATGAGLAAYGLAFGPLSGAHFNPAVTLVAWMRGEIRGRDLPAYWAGQFLAALVVVALAHAMFREPLLQLSRHARSEPSEIFSEAVAAFGLLAVGLAIDSKRVKWVAVGVYIFSASWFTESTAFANPAITLGRAFTNTLTGIRIEDVPAFLGAQLAGALLAYALFRWLKPADRITRSRASSPAPSSYSEPRRGSAAGASGSR